ncbi:hypothetical protein AMTR_s00067p00160600 [Amborella trichopoda]|uniref:Uncharacterized protein n=1 Tax=Amborella trichopoda TaxID=13333 RepID=U5CZV4_AMBTC|nr:hypothetical protein AMTR_s00067p00160600 [Amborella trichopoda]
MTQGSETLHRHKISSSCEADEESTAAAAPHLLFDLLPLLVSKLHEIANRMVSSSYRNEYCDAFSSLRREFLEESILRVGFQKLGVEDV